MAGTASEPSEQKDTILSAAADKNGAPGDKLEDTAVVVKDDEVPEIHWAFWAGGTAFEPRVAHPLFAAADKGGAVRLRIRPLPPFE
jgi:hypothetical protein